MATKTIANLNAATAANVLASMLLEIDSGTGSSYKITGQQLINLILDIGGAGAIQTGDVNINTDGALNLIGSDGLNITDGLGSSGAAMSCSGPVTIESFANIDISGSNGIVIDDNGNGATVQISPAGLIYFTSPGGIQMDDKDSGAGITMQPMGNININSGNEINFTDGNSTNFSTNGINVNGIGTFTGTFQVLTALPSTFKTVTVHNGFITSVA
jgi:hypothetical protein